MVPLRGYASRRRESIPKDFHALGDTTTHENGGRVAAIYQATKIVCRSVPKLGIYRVIYEYCSNTIIDYGTAILIQDVVLDDGPYT